jgi:outer membrane lipoprotein LolB
LSSRIREWGVAAALAAMLLAGCAAAPSREPFSASVATDAPFAIDGRLSVRRGNEAVAANFSWRHEPHRDEISLSSPLGQALAEISADALTPRYELRGADGRREEAPDWSALTERALGASLPVEGLATWIVGAPRPGAPYRVESDGSGRPAVLRQDGWEIVFGYADAEARLPARMQLSQQDVELRIVVLQRR